MTGVNTTTTTSVMKDNEGSSSDVFAGFATLIDDENLPGFDSLNNSNFFDQVMNASKLFDGDDGSSWNEGSWNKLNNDSFASLKSAAAGVMKPSKKIAEGTIDEVDNEEETDSERAEFEGQLLCAYLVKKIEKKQQEDGQDDGQNSVTSATASVTSFGSAGSKSLTLESILGQPATAGTAEGATPLSSNNTARTRSKRKKRATTKKLARSATTEDASVISVRSERTTGRRRHTSNHRPVHRRASMGATPMNDDSIRPQSRSAGMDGSSTSRGGGQRRRGSNRGMIAEEEPETPNRRQRLRDRSRSMGKVRVRADHDDDDVGSIISSSRGQHHNNRPDRMDLRRVTRDPRRGRGSVALEHDILKRNLQQLMDQSEQEQEELDASEQQQQHQEVWKQRRQRSSGATNEALVDHIKNAALERAARVGSIHAAAVTLTTPKPAKKLSINADGALDRILQSGLSAKNESIQNKNSSSPTTTTVDDSCVSLQPGYRRASTASSVGTTRRIRRRGSCQ